MAHSETALRRRRRSIWSGRSGWTGCWWLTRCWAGQGPGIRAELDKLAFLRGVDADRLDLAGEVRLLRDRIGGDERTEGVLGERAAELLVQLRPGEVAGRDDHGVDGDLPPAVEDDRLQVALLAAQPPDGAVHLAALRALGVRPTGYRAPNWQLTETTLALLAGRGIRLRQQPDGR